MEAVKKTLYENLDGFEVYRLAEQVKVQMKPGFSEEAFIAAVTLLNQESNDDRSLGRKITFEFSEEVQITLRRKSKKVKSFTSYGFISTTGSVCYSERGRTGYFFGRIADKLVSMTINSVETSTDFFKRVERAKFDETTWSNLTADDFRYGGHKLRYIRKLFPRYAMEQLRKAFEEKTEFRYKMDGTKRDYSIETKMGEDGIFRAWFSSEYSGCGNGSYYLLLSPTVAVYMEDD